MMSQHWTNEEIERRLPRLVHFCKQAGILTTGEACSGIRDYRLARFSIKADSILENKWGKDMMRYGGGEAVSHMGGPGKLIECAIQLWRSCPR